MVSLDEIRKTFASDVEQGRLAGAGAWLIKGDFDHFKATNDLYGALIADYILDWTVEVIAEELKKAQSWWGSGEILCSVTGDDVTIYTPPGALGGGDIQRMLWRIREVIEESFYQHYLVGILPIPTDFFDDVPAQTLETIRKDLEQREVVLDFAARRRGFLILFPAQRDGKNEQALEPVIQTIQRRTGRTVPCVEALFDWTGESDAPAGDPFNDGYLVPPSVSFAACPARAANHAKTVRDGGIPAYERASLACQAAMKVCKLRRKGVQLYAEGEAKRFGMPEIPADIPGCSAARSDATAPLRWASERFLRESLYFRQLEQPVLFQINPVYDLASKLPADILQSEQYRGNGYGIGLKGINAICGQKTADRIIRQLMVIFSEGMRGALARKGIPAERVWAAQFVDRFTVCCEQPIFQTAEIVELASGMARLFNAVSQTMKVAHVRVSVAAGERKINGYRLFQELAFTSLAIGSTLARFDPPIEVRKNSSNALEEGREAMERCVIESAKGLAQYSPAILQG